MRLIIHDLTQEEFKGLNIDKGEAIIISDNGNIHNCIGCFGCWLKTPGQCVIKDSYMSVAKSFAASSEVLIISKCCYGSYSPFVKNVLDRNISYLLPDFTIIDGEMHHKKRYDKRLRLKAIFYGENITQEEINTAKRLVSANCDNFYADIDNILFVKTIDELGGMLR